MRGITVAIWGHSGSGRTTLSAALAQRLTATYASVLLVGTDMQVPSFAEWLPTLADDNREHQPLKSVANILAVPEITPDYLRQSIYIPQHNERMGLMGYLPWENMEYSTPVELAMAFDFIDQVQTFAEITVIDCSNPNLDALTVGAIQYCDIVIYLCTPTPKGMGWLTAMANAINFNESEGRAKRLILSLVSDANPCEYIESEMGLVSFARLPFIAEAREKQAQGELFRPYQDKGYRAVLDAAAALVQQRFDERNG